jgi:signal peptidase I
MLPTLRPGDRLLVVAWPRPGQLVAVRTPTGTVIKRIGAVAQTTVDLAGDNAGASTDYPATPKAAVLGRAVYRYAPSDRAGPPN